MESPEKIKEAIETLINACNIMGDSGVAEALNKEMQRTHRTIQQSFIGEFHKFLLMYAEYQHDARNEASVDFAQKVKELNAYFPFV